MMLFYPLDCVSFFSSSFAPVLHAVSPAVSRRAQLWSVRAWGVYVGLQIAQLVSEWRELQPKGDKAGGDEEDSTVRKRRQDVVCQLVANVSRFPVILHWSVVGGIYSSELWTDVLSVISAVAAFSGGWESMRVPPPTR